MKERLGIQASAKLQRSGAARTGNNHVAYTRLFWSKISISAAEKQPRLPCAIRVPFHSHMRRQKQISILRANVRRRIAHLHIKRGSEKVDTRIQRRTMTHQASVVLASEGKTRIQWNTVTSLRCD